MLATATATALAVITGNTVVLFEACCRCTRAPVHHGKHILPVFLYSVFARLCCGVCGLSRLVLRRVWTDCFGGAGSGDGSSVLISRHCLMSHCRGVLLFTARGCPWQRGCVCVFVITFTTNTPPIDTVCRLILHLQGKMKVSQHQNQTATSHKLGTTTGPPPTMS